VKYDCFEDLAVWQAGMTLTERMYLPIKTGSKR
jgi:hypothetical protein